MSKRVTAHQSHASAEAMVFSCFFGEQAAPPEPGEGAFHAPAEPDGLKAAFLLQAASARPELLALGGDVPLDAELLAGDILAAVQDRVAWQAAAAAQRGLAPAAAARRRRVLEGQLANRSSERQHFDSTAFYWQKLSG